MPQRRTTRRAERRRTERADARLSMRVEGAAHEAGTSALVTESQNISASGVYCVASHYIAPLSKVGLTIVLPRLPGGRAAKELIKCEGIVVRCQPATAKKNDRRFDLAFMFSDLAPEHRSRLDDYVTWRNLQALRAAAGALNGAARATRARTPAKRVAKKATGTARRTRVASPAAARPARKTSVRRRGTVH